MSVVFSYQDGIEPLNRFVDGIGTPPYSAAAVFAPRRPLRREAALPGCAPPPIAPSSAASRTTSISPGLSTQAIEAYRKGGFAQLVLEGKREYVENYNLGTSVLAGPRPREIPADRRRDQDAPHRPCRLPPRRRRRRASAPKTTRRPPAGTGCSCSPSRRTRKPRRSISASPTCCTRAVSSRRPWTNTSVRPMPIRWAPDSAKAGYAALVAYQKQEPLLPEAERAAWKLRVDRVRREVRADLPRTSRRRRRADARHRRSLQGKEPAARHRSGRAAAGAQSAGDGRAAAHRHERDRPGAVRPRRIRRRPSRPGLQARALAAGDPALQKSLTEQLSVAVYRQAEAKRAAGDAAGAVE